MKTFRDRYGAATFTRPLDDTLLSPLHTDEVHQLLISRVDYPNIIDAQNQVDKFLRAFDNEEKVSVSAAWKSWGENDGLLVVVDENGVLLECLCFQASLEALCQQLELVWAIPLDLSHGNEYDINAAGWARTASHHPKDLESLRRLVTKRLTIRARWLYILSALKIETVPPQQEFTGYSDVKLYRDTLGHYLREDPVGKALYFDGSGTIYPYFPMMYGEEILKRELFDKFKQIAVKQLNARH